MNRLNIPVITLSVLFAISAYGQQTRIKTNPPSVINKQKSDLQRLIEKSRQRSQKRQSYELSAADYQRAQAYLEEQTDNRPTGSWDVIEKYRAQVEKQVNQPKGAQLVASRPQGDPKANKKKDRAEFSNLEEPQFYAQNEDGSFKSRIRDTYQPAKQKIQNGIEKITSEQSIGNQKIDTKKLKEKLEKERIEQYEKKRKQRIAETQQKYGYQKFLNEHQSSVDQSKQDIDESQNETVRRAASPALDTTGNVVTFFDGEATGDYTFNTDFIYELRGKIYVDSGETLTIDPGAVIKADFGSALIVSRGATINANGTADNPIVFTSLFDTIQPPASSENLYTSLSDFDRGLWGGIIILGEAETTQNSGLGSVDDFLGNFDPRNEFGGADSVDNSGSLSYVTIRHAGAFLNARAMAGLVLAGVGSGTQVDHIEVYANDGYGVEYVGGTVNTSHIYISNNTDIAIGSNDGYTGKSQFVYIENESFQTISFFGNFGDPAITPYTDPLFYNITAINPGSAIAAFEANGSGSIKNSIFDEYDQGVTITYDDMTESSWNRVLDNSIELQNNFYGGLPFNNYLGVWDQSPMGTFSDDPYNYSNLQDNASFVDPDLNGNGVPQNDVTVTFPDAGDPFLTPTTYAGAFEPGQTPWFEGWTTANVPPVIDIDINDYQALIALYEATGGSNWFTPWDTAGTPPSEWFGVNVMNNRVVNLTLGGNNLQGPIPNEIGNLTELQTLNIEVNGITALPDSIHLMSNLNVIIAYNNGLSDIPQKFGDIPDLRLIDFSVNQFPEDQPIPDVIFDADSLEFIYFNDNQASSIPTSISDLSILRELHVNGNRFNDLGNVLNSNSALQVLAISYSGLTKFPEINNLNNLSYLELVDNDIFDQIPENYGDLSNLSIFFAFGNRIFGTIPSSFSQLDNLFQIDLSANALNLPLPDELGDMASLSYLYLGENKIPGTIPVGLTNSTSLLELDINRNRLTGPIPPEIGNLTQLQNLSLWHNFELSGEVPVEIGQLTNLFNFDCNDCDLTGTIPSEIGNLSNLNTLYLNANNFTGAVPPEIDSLSNLFLLWIFDNELEDLPDMRDMASLSTFWAFQNRFEFDDFEPLMQHLPFADIASQKQDEDVFIAGTLGASIELDGTIGGTNNNYQWYFNGQPLFGEDSVIFNIDSFDPGSAGVFTVEVTNDSVTSNTGLIIYQNYVVTYNDPVVESDSSALVDLYNATNLFDNWSYGENWLNTPVALWEGITIENERVVEINLPFNAMTGGIPPSIASLDQLRVLNVSGNDINFIPSELWSLSSLEYLDLNGNNLEGELSSSIGNLINLQILNIGNNDWQGDLPESIFDLSQLRELWMLNGGFSGSLSASIGNLTNLEILAVGGNIFSGPLPNEIGSLSNLYWYYDYGNDWSGTIPASFFDLPITRITLGFSPLIQGELPVGFQNFTNLEELRIFVNDLSISGLPSWVGDFENLKTLNINDCDLGPDPILPAFINNLTKLENLSIGQIDWVDYEADTLDLASLKLLALFQSNVSELPIIKADSMQVMYIYQNKLTSLPDLSLLGDFELFGQLFAYENQLTFDDFLPYEGYFMNAFNYVIDNQALLSNDTTIVIQDGEMISVELAINLSDTNMNTTVNWFNDGNYITTINPNDTLIQTSFVDFFGFASFRADVYNDIITPLTGLYLFSGNTIVTVDFPPQPVIEGDSMALVYLFDSLNGFEWFDRSNWRSGPVSTWFGVGIDGDRVSYLSLPGNNLSGEIPDTVGVLLTALRELYLQDNNITGDIPTSLFESGSYDRIDLGRNQLTGPIPSEIGNNTSLTFLGLAGNKLSGSIPQEIGELNILSEFYVDQNYLSGPIPNSFASHQWSGFAVDRNYLTAIPDGMDTVLQFAFYSNFDYNELTFDQLAKIEGVGVDQTFQGQNPIYDLEITLGTPAVGNDVTLEITNTSEEQDFVWYRVFKDGFIEELAFTGTDNSLTVTVAEPDLGALYFVRAYSPLFRGYGYPIYSNFIQLDTIQGKFAIDAEASVEFNYAPATGVIGPPDDIDGAFDGKNYYQPIEWGDRLTVTFDNPEPLSYIRLFDPKNSLGPGRTGLLDIVFYGESGEKDSIRVNRIMETNEIYQFVETPYNVTSIDLYIAGALDAIEVGTAPLPGLPGEAMVNDQNSYSRTRAYVTEMINAPFGYIGFSLESGVQANLLAGASTGFQTVIERSQGTPDAFSVVDTVDFISGFYNDFALPAVDTIYYRTKVIDGTNESAFSQVLKLGNCETLIPGLSTNDENVESYWNATTHANGDFADFDTSADSVIIFNALWGENNFIIQNGNFHARWFDQFTDTPDTGETQFFDNCGSIQLNGSFGQLTADSLSGRYENDTLYLYWENDLNGITGTTKLVYVGPVEEEEPQTVLKPANPSYLVVGVWSTDAIAMSWEYEFSSSSDEDTNQSLAFGPVEEYVIYRSEGDDQNFVEIGSVGADTTFFFDPNLLNGTEYYYRITANNSGGESFPSNASAIIHKVPLFDPATNTITLDDPKITYGASWADMDRDGDLDVYVANAFDFGNNYLYENLGGGNFKKIVSTVTTTDITTTRTSAWGDIDNDGFLDLYVPNGTLSGEEVFDAVYRNTGSKSFTKVEGLVTETRAEFTPSEGGVWADVNNDSFVDLVKTTGYVMINDGTGGFVSGDTLATLDAPLNVLDSYNWTIRALDYDLDKDQDIYITGQLYNMLFENDGDGNFTFVENAISGNDLRSRNASWADYDNDGDLDVLTGEWVFDVFEDDNLNYYQLGLYENDGGNFIFRSLSDLVGYPVEFDFESRVGRGYTWLDFDNDGHQDVIWTIAGGQNLLLRNKGNKSFEILFPKDQLFQETTPFSHISVADINGDGRTDIFFANHDFESSNYIYYNNGTEGNNWLKIRLQGTQSNSYAIGAGVKVTAGGMTQYQDVTTQNGLGAGNSLELNFGVGSAGTIDMVQVFWPAGDTTTLENVPTNQILNIAEQPDVNPDDQAALEALYNATGGDSWTNNNNWLVEGVSPRTWTGTFFNAEGRLTSLVLNENNLVGEIPTEITQLSALEILDLSGNQLTGSIPESLGDMTTLTSLSLNDNQLEGSIPESIAALVNLVNLDLYNNQLIGELPETLGGLTSLKQFEIQNNEFIGLFPSDLIALEQLEVLDISQNVFEGELPAGIGSMAQLKVLNIYDNQFFGSLPEELSGLVELLELDVSNNDFEGELATSFSEMTALVKLNLAENSISGSFEPFADLDSVRTVSIQSNRFEELPALSTEVLEMMDARNNSLDFGDFENNSLLIEEGALAVDPQDSLFDRVDSLHNVGVPLTISYEIGGNLNTYAWLLDGEPLQGSANVTISGSTVNIENPDTQDEGEYILVINSDQYPDITLVTNPFNLKITSLERDRQALLDFIAAVNDGEFPYVLSGWDEETEDLNSWTGIVVEDNRVTELKLPAIIEEGNTQILDGRVPNSFADLTGLKEVDLSGNFLRSLPKISHWTNLTSAVFIQNRLSFKDIVPNLDLGSVFSYDPQRRYGVTIDTVAEAGDDYIASTDLKFQGVEYQWKFGPFIPGEPFNNDVSDIPDANSRVLLVENLNFEKMGTYRVEMTHPTTGNFTIETRNINVRAKAQLFGSVFADGDGTLLTDGDVVLWREPVDGPFLKEDSVQLKNAGDSIGTYGFRDIILGNFILQARPDREVFPNTIQTYFEKADLYDSATILEVRDKLDGIDIEMVFYEEPDPDPTGADFEGTVETDFPDDENVDEEGNRISGRRKAKRAACSMRRLVRKGRVGQEEDEYELYAYVESDDEGKFNFTDVEEGSYLLNIQYPGVPMDPDSEIKFEVGGDKENQLFTISAVITEDGIVVESEEVLYSLKPYIKDLRLYPNPTADVLKGEFLVYRKLNDLKVEILDVRGIKLMEQALNHRMGPQSLEVDFSKLESGVYFMIFTDEAGTFRQQFKVGKK